MFGVCAAAHVTLAWPVAASASALLTPGTDCNASLTRRAQPAQVIPLTVSVVVEVDGAWLTKRR